MVVTLSDIIKSFEKHESMKKRWGEKKPIDDERYKYETEFSAEGCVYDQHYEDLSTEQKIILKHNSEAQVFKQLKIELQKQGINEMPWDIINAYNHYLSILHELEDLYEEETKIEN